MFTSLHDLLMMRPGLLAFGKVLRPEEQPYDASAQLIEDLRRLI